MTAAAAQGPNAAELRADARRERLVLGALAAPGLLLIGVVALAPIAWLFWLSVRKGDSYTLEHYARLLHPSYAYSLQTTFELTFLVTAICALLGYPLAYMIAQARQRAAAILLLFVLFPVWTSLLVRCYAWLVLLQRRGLVNTWLADAGLIDLPLRLVHNFTGTTIGMVHIMLPFMVLPLYATMRAIDRDYVRAAANLGATPSQAFRHVYVPLSLPGLAAGIIIVFILCLGFYVTPALLGGGRVMTWSMQIERNVTYHSDWGAASALGVVLLAMALAIFWAVGRVIGFNRILGGR
ncbi:MAG: ABC transporter permease [Alphaproteobacteria bacterium]|nr:ABC transporter permease [Alphaproteobacteria bacterium]MBM3626317.1 ABC transporter permease [Alphaproteobacteria bacterium]